jgi:hypothetical protein
MYHPMMEAVRTSETSVDNLFTRQYNPEDSSEQQLKPPATLCFGCTPYKGVREVAAPSRLLTFVEIK